MEETRPVRFLDSWQAKGGRFKIYGITYGGDETPDPKLVAAAKEAFSPVVFDVMTPRSGYQPLGVGFLGIHQGKGFNYCFLCWWANGNEIFHRAMLAPSSDPLNLTPDSSDMVACIYDLALMAFEREAFVETMARNPDGPDESAYLSRRLNMEV